MRAFIILGFMLAAVSAAKLGYNYGPGVSGTRQIVSGGNLIGGGYSGGSGNLIGGGGIVSGGGLIGGGLVGNGGYSGGYSGGSGNLIGGGSIVSGGGYSGGSGILGGASAVLNSYGSHSSNVGGGGSALGLSALNSVPQTVEYNKQVYYFSAPEEAHNEGETHRQLSNILKKNLQVIFIKAPENNAATNAALQIAKQAIEQRTAIYLLSKENDASQVVGQLQQIQENVQTAPEVRIVKYRTAQDLAHAREHIQSQYDNFGGPSNLINGGTVPVLNYASPGTSAGSINVIGGGGAVGNGGSYVSNVGSSLGGGSLVSGLGVGKLVGGGGFASGLGLGQSLGGGSYVSGGSVLGGGGSSVLGGSSSIGGVKYVSGGGSSIGNNVLSEYLPPKPLRK